MDRLLTMGFVRSDKLYEKRISILPEDLLQVRNCGQLYFEEGYGLDFHIKDQEYKEAGAHIVSRKEALMQDIICDTKIGEASYLNQLKEHTQLFGWIHAGADPALTELLVDKKFTCFAWEDMYENERHIFWRNNQIAGGGGVLNAMQYCGFLPYGLRAGIIGRGDTAIGAYHMLSSLGADVSIYSRKQEVLFKKELSDMDIVVMAVRWDTQRKDYLISSEDRRKMKADAIIIDISDDVDGAIEQSISTTIAAPVYHRENILTYSVCNVPSIFYKTSTRGISHAVLPYIDELVSGVTGSTLQKALIAKDGVILDERINRQQNRTVIES